METRWKGFYADIRKNALADASYKTNQCKKKIICAEVVVRVYRTYRRALSGIKTASIIKPTAKSSVVLIYGDKITETELLSSISLLLLKRSRISIQDTNLKYLMYCAFVSGKPCQQPTHYHQMLVNLCRLNRIGNYCNYIWIFPWYAGSLIPLIAAVKLLLRSARIRCHRTVLQLPPDCEESLLNLYTSN